MAITVLMAGLVLSVISPTVMQADNYVLKSGTAKEQAFQAQGSILGVDPLFSLHLDVDPGTPSTCIVMLLNQTEYDKYLLGTPLTGLMPVLQLTVEYDASVNVTGFLADDVAVANGNLFLIVFNQDVQDVHIYSYLSVAPPLYIPSILLIASGILCLIALQVRKTNGWRRHFWLGVEVNAIFFFIRSAFLPHFFSEIFSPGDLFDVEMYGDFQMLYMHWTSAFMSGISPYSPVLSDYLYTPLFILILGFVNLLPFPAWKLAIPIIICNMGIAWLVGRFAEEFTRSQRKASYVVWFCMLSPFTLLYGSIMWFNPPPFVFFTLLAFYLVLQKKNNWAIIAFGIATMIKQFAAIFLPLLLITMWKINSTSSTREKTKNLFKSLGIFGGIILLVSLPFLITDWQGYLGRILGVGYSVNYVADSPLYVNSPVTFDSFFIYLGAPASFTLILAYLLSFYVLLGGSVILVLVKFGRYLSQKRSQLQDKVISDPNFRAMTILREALFWALIISLCLQLFFPRGSYKYYLILFAPFVAMFYNTRGMFALQFPDQPDTSISLSLKDLLPLVLSYYIFIAPRYLCPVILLFWMFYYLLQKRKVEKKEKLSDR